MGIGKGANLLFSLKSVLPFHGSILQLGRQSIYVEAAELPEMASKYGHAVNVDNVRILADGEYDPETYNAEIFFQMLGFDHVSSIDISLDEGAEFAHDLNKEIPAELQGRFDFIYDGGTLEHIFDAPQALRNIHSMLKPNGVIMHCNPTHNHVDHGFYMFSPTFFWDYYKNNGYEIIRSQIYEYEHQHSQHYPKPWTVYEYQAGSIQHMEHGGWGRRQLGIWFVARKSDLATSDVVPQQGMYQRIWEDQVIRDPYAITSSPTSLTSRLRKFLVAHPKAYAWLRPLVGQVRHFQTRYTTQGRPPVVDEF